MKKALMIALIAITIGGCGFKPLNTFTNRVLGNYNTNVNVSNYDKAPRKVAFVLSDYLRQELNRENQPERYTLNLNLTKSTDSFETQSNTINLRTRVTLTVNYELIDNFDHKTMMTDKIIAIDSYEESNSPYGTLVSSEEIVAKMAKSIASEIKLRIASKLS